MGILEAICISEEKGTIKTPVSSASLQSAWGIEGDAHAGAWHRQVSLLAGESIDEVRKVMPELDYGMFGENLITRDIDLPALVTGDHLKIGDSVVLEVTQIGKECHNGGCPIQQATGDCIMPRQGIFCKVLAGGTVSAGSPVAVLERGE